MNIMTPAQLAARLEYASHLCSWRNVHVEMKPAMVGLMRRGLAVRRQKDNAFFLSEAGEELLKAKQQCKTSRRQHDSGHQTIIEGAEYWLDKWDQQIPR